MLCWKLRKYVTIIYFVYFNGVCRFGPSDLDFFSLKEKKKHLWQTHFRMLVVSVVNTQYSRSLNRFCIRCMFPPNYYFFATSKKLEKHKLEVTCIRIALFLNTFYVLCILIACRQTECSKYTKWQTVVCGGSCYWIFTKKAITLKRLFLAALRCVHT